MQDFTFSLDELSRLVSRLDGMKVAVTALVGERFLDLIETGFSESIVFNSSLQLRFLGSSPQVFRPGMPFKAYVSARALCARCLSVCSVCTPCFPYNTTDFSGWRSTAVCNESRLCKIWMIALLGLSCVFFVPGSRVVHPDKGSKTRKGVASRW